MFILYDNILSIIIMELYSVTLSMIKLHDWNYIPIFKNILVVMDWKTLFSLVLTKFLSYSAVQQAYTNVDCYLWNNFIKNNLKKIWKPYIERAKTIIPTSQDRKWAGLADILWYSQFQQWKEHQCFICLRGTIVKYFGRVRGFVGG